jgi:hypothetical protein
MAPWRRRTPVFLSLEPLGESRVVALEEPLPAQAPLIWVGQLATALDYPGVSGTRTMPAI